MATSIPKPTVPATPTFKSTTSNPWATSTWTQGANGGTFSNQLTGANQKLYDTATSGLTGLMTPTAGQQPPKLLDSVGGLYQDKLASTIFDRTWGTQQNDINAQRQQMAARLAEQGFTPGNEGYINEMNRWEDNLGEMRQNISRDAQIQAANQALAEGNFTNSSRTQDFSNNMALRQQMAEIMSGARDQTLAGLDQNQQAQQMAGQFDLGQGQLYNQAQGQANDFALGQGQLSNQGRQIDNQFTLGKGELNNSAQSIANQFTLGSQQNQTAAQQVANQHTSAMTGHSNTAQQLADQFKLGSASNQNQAQQIANEKAYKEWVAKSAGAQGKNAQQNDLIRALLQWGIG